MFNFNKEKYMKNSKNFLSAALLTTLFISPCFASNQFMEDQKGENGNKKTALVLQEEVFKGNWTENFILKDGSPIVHTPNYVSLGFMTGGKGLNLISPSYNNIPMTEEGLRVKTNSTREEFIEALITSGLYNSK